MSLPSVVQGGNLQPPAPKPTAKMPTSLSLEAHFDRFRQHIIGIDQTFKGPHNDHQRIIYTDWTASGRMYGPIERLFTTAIHPLVANTHTETNLTGKAMTIAYHKAFATIKEHVGATEEDVVICCNSGMTGVQNKFLRILGLRVPERFRDRLDLKESERPVVFVTHMEHHSNQTSWLETICDVEIIRPDAEGLVDLGDLARLLELYKDRPVKYAAVTACSNVTGIITPYHRIAEMMHAVGGFCFVDLACSAPYVDIDMHPANPRQKLDAIYFSPHKFIGGPGSGGVLVFDRALYANAVPDNPGGGTVEWTTPWKRHRYIESVEAREDGGTPAFLQTIRAALAIKLKEEMGVSRIQEREQEQLAILWPALQQIEGLHLLAPNISDRLPILSFCIDGLHHDMGVKLLNDRFGIQVRGGCSCAGTYGHYLLHITEEHSRIITDRIDHGDSTLRPGWIRLSIHPTTNDRELHQVVDALSELTKNHEQWSKDYDFDAATGRLCFSPKERDTDIEAWVNDWFDPSHLVDAPFEKLRTQKDDESRRHKL